MASPAVYYCHNCETNVLEVLELDDGCLQCKQCNEEYIEIVQSDIEQEPDDTDEKKDNNRNNNNVQVINNGNTSIFYFNTINFNINRLFGVNGDYAFGDINNLISSLGINGSRGPPPASKDIVKELKEFEFKDKESHLNETDDGNQCAICKEEFESGEMVKQMPCHHLYHKECIEQWLNNANNCPVCRHRLKTDDVHYEQMQTQSQLM